MRETYTSTHQLPVGGDVATPHAWVNDTLIAVPWRNLDGIAPAGSVNSSVSDLARWIRVVLDSGRLRSIRGADTSRLVSAATFAELFKPQAIVPTDFYPAWTEFKPHVATYGLGWFLFDYHGHRVAMHTGSIDGMSAIIGLLPDDRVGVVVLANQDHAELRHALLLRAFECISVTPPATGAPICITCTRRSSSKPIRREMRERRPAFQGPSRLFRSSAMWGSTRTACTERSPSGCSRDSSWPSAVRGSQTSNRGGMTRSGSGGTSGRGQPSS